MILVFVICMILAIGFFTYAYRASAKWEVRQRPAESFYRRMDPRPGWGEEIYDHHTGVEIYLRRNRKKVRTALLDPRKDGFEEKLHIARAEATSKAAAMNVGD